MLLSDVEIAGGMVFGFDESIQALPAGKGGFDPRGAVEAVVTDALRHPPCVVTFSGGRDSSAMLATAAHVSRREGLAPPIPVTLRITGSPDADESEWQELVVRHLDLDDWVRITVGDELDVVGPVATAAMQRHGLLWPFNTHFHIPMFEQARGGTIITGSGGDELGMSTATAKAERILARRHLSSPTEAAIVGLALSPSPIRGAVHYRRETRELESRSWLTPAGRRAIAIATARMESQIPLGWNRVVRRAIWRARYFRLAISCFDAVAATFEARAVHPLFDRGVLTSLADRGGFSGVGSRTDLMQMLFGDLLPIETISRSSKATFDDVLWARHARDFATRWSGTGVPSSLVDTDRLRRHWLGERPHATTATLMQVAWLHDHGGEATRSGSPQAGQLS